MSGLHIPGSANVRTDLRLPEPEPVDARAGERLALRHAESEETTLAAVARARVAVLAHMAWLGHDRRAKGCLCRWCKLARALS